jgi:hypothetical protein
MGAWKFNNILTKDILYQEYITNNKTSKEIAEQFGVSISTVCKYLLKYSIIKDKKVVKINRIGKKYGKLTILNMFRNSKNRQTMCECRCECGNIHYTNIHNLRKSRNMSCGCSRRKIYTYIERVAAIHKKLYGSTIVARSKELKLDYNITLNDYIMLIKQPCYYCGALSSNYSYDKRVMKLDGTFDKNHKVIYRYNGIDRLDSNKGYLRNNVVPCCKYCNHSKSNRTSEEFVSWMKNLYYYYTTTHNTQMDIQYDI